MFFYSARVVRLFLVTGLPSNCLESAVDSGLDADAAKAALAAQGCREKEREGAGGSREGSGLRQSGR